MKRFYKILGIICVATGFIGVFVPLLPTTPFILLAMFLFYKSDKRYADWILKNKILSPYVKNYLEKKGVPIYFKVRTMMLLWVTISVSIIFFSESLHLKIFLLIVAVSVSIHILKMKTLK